MPTFDPLEPRTNKSVYAFAAAIRDQFSAMLRNDFAANQGFTKFQLWQTPTNTAGAEGMYFGDTTGAMWDARVDTSGNFRFDRFSGGAWQPDVMTFDKATGRVLIGSGQTNPNANDSLVIGKLAGQTAAVISVRSGGKGINLFENGNTHAIEAFDWGAGAPLTLTVQPNGGLMNVGSNVSIGTSSTSSFGGAQIALFLANRTAAPTSAPTNGVVIYAESGAAKVRGTSGTTTTFGPADPHCAQCGSDFTTEHYNEAYGYVSICLFCLANELGDRPYIVRHQVDEHRLDVEKRQPADVEGARAARLLEARTLTETPILEERLARADH